MTASELPGPPESAGQSEPPDRPKPAGRPELSGRSVLIGAVRGQRRDVVASGLLAAAHQVGEALVPVLIGVLIDRAVRTGSTGNLLAGLVALGAVFTFLSFSYRFAARAGERAAERAAHALRAELTRRVLDPRGGAEAGRLPGALVSVATADARRVGAVNLAVPAAIAALTGVVATAVALFWVSVPLGLLVLLGTPPLFWLAHLLARPLERRSEVEQERAAHASGIAADLVSGVRVVKGIGAETAAVNRYRRTSQESLAATLRAARAQAWHSGTMLAVIGVLIAVVALVGGQLAARGQITVGALVTAVGLALFLVTPLSLFSWVNAEFAQVRASAARVASVLGAPPAVTGGQAAPTPPVRGRIQFHGVRHGSLTGFDLDVPAGELVCLVAAEPADAESILRCLSRAADPAAGRVELDGVPLVELDPAAVHAAILVAAHDADLFEGTVRDNLAGPPGPPRAPTAGERLSLRDEPPTSPADGADSPLPEAVRRALSAAAADEVVGSLPDGLATVLTERGRSLSGGQRQRVALARALAAEPPVLVLHDPTTAVDAVTEARIAAGIQALRRGRTTLVAATSPALLAVADRVVVVREGRVRAESSHTDLLDADPDYRSLVFA